MISSDCSTRTSEFRLHSIMHRARSLPAFLTLACLCVSVLLCARRFEGEASLKKAYPLFLEEMLHSSVIPFQKSRLILHRLQMIKQHRDDEEEHHDIGLDHDAERVRQHVMHD